MMQRIFSFHMHLCHKLIFNCVKVKMNIDHIPSLISYFFVSGNHYHRYTNIRNEKSNFEIVCPEIHFNQQAHTQYIMYHFHTDH